MLVIASLALVLEAAYSDTKMETMTIHAMESFSYNPFHFQSLLTNHVLTWGLMLLQNENRTLWKLGTLPPGLITYYSTTKPLDKSWHVLGLGYNPSISMDEINNAAVVHFNGNMKPWLDIAMAQFKPLWTKYVDYELDFVQACNFGI